MTQTCGKCERLFYDVPSLEAHRPLGACSDPKRLGMIRQYGSGAWYLPGEQQRRAEVLQREQLDQWLYSRD